jgi:two-component system OmpR family sensor kinase
VVGAGCTAVGFPSVDGPVLRRFSYLCYSRSRAYGGSGLGLAIVEAIVHAHHGQVGVESVVGVGTAVTIRLPDGQRRS